MMTEQFTLFPEIKIPKRERTKWDELCEMQAVVGEHGALVPPASAAEVLDVSKQRVDQLINKGALRAFEFFGKRWVCQSDLKGYVETGRKSGRRPGWNKEEQK
jgi:hypothetical protein